MAEEGRICPLIYSSGQVNEKSAVLHQIKYISFTPPLPNSTTKKLLLEGTFFVC